jgi:hypothetical protein
MRRYGFVADPVLWQIVIRVGGVLVGDGVTVGDGHAAVPITTASPVWRRCPRRSLPEREFGFAIARLETVIRRHGFESEPVLWQIVIFVAAALDCAADSPPLATAPRLARTSGITVRVARISRFIFVPLSLLISTSFPCFGIHSPSKSPFLQILYRSSLQTFYTPRACKGDV